MKKLLLLSFITFLNLFFISHAFSENKQILFSYNIGNENHTLEWGSSIEDLNNLNLNVNTYDLIPQRMPFWEDVAKMSSEATGYIVRSYFANIQYFNIKVLNLELLYYYPSDETDGTDKSLSQLYMVRMTPDSEIDSTSFNKLINSLSKSYGKPVLKEHMISQGNITVIGPILYSGPYKKYKQTYTWSGINNSGLRITVDYTDFNKSYDKYDNIVIILGQTNMDHVIDKSMDNKTTGFTNDAFMFKVTVEKKRIALRDENKKTIQKLEVGTVLEIVGYDHDMNMFTAIVVDGSSSAQEKAAKGSFDGYVYGDNLSVSRAELLEKYKN